MNLLIDIFTLFSLATIPATFNYFLDYCLGHPMSEQPSRKAIFFSYSLWLAQGRVPLKKYRELIEAFEPLLTSEDEDTKHQGKQQLEMTVLTTGREKFYLEQALGMCPFCTNFWMSLFTAFVLFHWCVPLVINPILYFIIIPIFSHTILRKL